MIVFPKVEELTALDRLKASGGPLDGCKVDCYVNNLTPTEDNVIGDFTIGSWDGYAQSATVVWGGSYINAQDQAEIDSQVLTFTQDGSDDPQTAYGYLVTKAGALVYSERFPEPVPMTDATSACVFVTSVTLETQAG